MSGARQHRWGADSAELLWRAVRSGVAGEGAGWASALVGLDEPIQRAARARRLRRASSGPRRALEVTGIDARHHIMDHYAELVAELGCVSRESSCAPQSLGVLGRRLKVASQTPLSVAATHHLRNARRAHRASTSRSSRGAGPWRARSSIRGSRREGRGPQTRRRIARPSHGRDYVGITVVADEVFDLALLSTDHRAHDRRRGARPPAPDTTVQGLAPGGADAAPTRLWLSQSGGSAGR